MFHEKHLSNSVLAQLSAEKKIHDIEMSRIKGGLKVMTDQWEAYEYTLDDEAFILLDTVFKDDLMEVWNKVLDNHDQMKAWTRKQKKVVDEVDRINDENVLNIYSEAFKKDRNGIYDAQLKIIDIERNVV
ncbi:hypothetical protein EAF04_009258 [Stromatinia cepivora]|nr:hypothetical protein EAF04_009258 [Stromatinia cepivora]